MPAAPSLGTLKPHGDTQTSSAQCHPSLSICWGLSLAVQQQLAPGPPPQPSVFGKLPPIKHKSAAAPKLPAAISKTCSNPGCKMPHLGQRCRHACRNACWQHDKKRPHCSALHGKWLQRCLPPASHRQVAAKTPAARLTSRWALTRGIGTDSKSKPANSPNA